ncbi:YhdP family protein [Ottowia pentelensis]
MRIVGALLLLIVLAWSALHWFIVPRIDVFRPRLQAAATQALGTSVTIGTLTVEANGLVPQVAVRDLRVPGPDGQGGLRVPRALVVFSVASLLRGGVEQLVIDDAELALARDAQGRWWLGGLDLSAPTAGDTRAADWLFAQEEIVLRNARLSWTDAQQGAPPAAFERIDAVLRNGLRRHQWRVDATPPPAWGERFTLIGQFRQALLERHAGRWQSWDGQLYASLPGVQAAAATPLAPWLQAQGVGGLRGAAALRLWLDVRRGAPVDARADVALQGAAATLASRLAPLAFADLSTRLVWRRQADGFQASTQVLRFTLPDGTAWPGGNLSFSHRAAGGTLQADRLDLAMLARLAASLPLPPAWGERLQRQPVAGLIERVDARWDGPLQAPSDWRLQARATGLRVDAQERAPDAKGHARPGVPGVEGATLQLDAGPAGGHASVTIANGALSFPGVFEEPRIPLDALKTQAQWRVQGERIEVQVDELTLANADAAGRFSARWHSGDNADGSGARFPGVLDLQGGFSRANGARVYRYLPLSIPAPARHYVRDAVRKGDGRDVTVRVQGRLHELPYNLPGEVGTFRIAAPVSGVLLAYVPPGLQPKGQAPWPALEALKGELVFERAGMQVHAGAAQVQGHAGWRWAGIEAGVPDFKQPRVQVQATGSGPLAAALAIVRDSPVAEFTHHALDGASASGDATLDLKLDLPVHQLEQAKVQGRVRPAGNTLRLAAAAPPLEQASGAVSFSEAGFAIEGAQARALGGSVQVSGGTAADASRVQIQASGQASAEGLRQAGEWGPAWSAVAALARQASGSADYQLELGFQGQAMRLDVRSALRGLALDWPAPLDKPADAAWPLHVELAPAGGPGGGARERLQVQLADRLALELQQGAGAPPRGAVALGQATAQPLALPAAGVHASVRWPEIDVDAWQRAVDRLTAAPARSGAAPATEAAAPTVPTDTALASGGAGLLPEQWTFDVGVLQVDRRKLHELHAVATRSGEHWQAQVQARELAGRLEYTEGAHGQPGAVRARLSRLNLAAGDAADANALEQPPSRIPALDVVVDEFELHGHKLGRLEVQAVNLDADQARAAPDAEALQDWQLTRLALTVPEASLSASGRWATQPGAPALPPGARSVRSAADQRRTALDFKLDVRDAGALLARFGMAGVLRGGQGRIDGELGWVGSPYSPHYPSMDGKLHLDIGAGQFLKADPGLAKLLGVLSLQALPRRLTLDFRDVFSSGFAFDFVRGDAQITHGVAHTSNLQMKGVNAAVLMDGQVNLDAETQKLRVLVVPEIDAGTAALATALINPAIGLGAFVAQLVLKQPLAQAATREFEITGSWDNPEVVPVKLSADAAAAAASAAAAAAAAASPAPKEK